MSWKNNFKWLWIQFEKLIWIGIIRPKKQPCSLKNNSEDILQYAQVKPYICLYKESNIETQQTTTYPEVIEVFKRMQTNKGNKLYIQHDYMMKTMVPWSFHGFEHHHSSTKWDHYLDWIVLLSKWKVCRQKVSKVHL